jgi:hypothetical protein
MDNIKVPGLAQIPQEVSSGWRPIDGVIERPARIDTLQKGPQRERVIAEKNAKFTAVRLQAFHLADLLPVPNERYEEDVIRFGQILDKVEGPRPASTLGRKREIGYQHEHFETISHAYSSNSNPAETCRGQGRNQRVAC